VLAKQRDPLWDLGRYRLLVVGDVMLDCLVRGRVRRISPEAPVPVLESTYRAYAAGGAANVAANARSLGAAVDIVGVVGADAEGVRLRRILAEQEIDDAGIFTDPSRPTTTKTRIVAQNQQIVRVDRESRDAVDVDLARRMFRYAEERLCEVDIVVVSDYAKGVVAAHPIAALLAAARRRGVRVLVDPKGGGASKYTGASVVTPNRDEVVRLASLDSAQADDPDVVHDASQKLLADLKCSVVLVTQGAEGMTVFEASGRVTAIPAVVREAYDSTGAGDTVAATLALALAARRSIADAARIASVAAGVVVTKVGTATLTSQELNEAYGAWSKGLGARVRERIHIAH
jgi:rfaE bifunctional protein kinase chain/domain